MAVAAKIGEGLKEIKNPERHKKMAEVGEQFEKYSKDVDKLIALKQEQNKLTKDVLDPLGLKSRARSRSCRPWQSPTAGNSNSMVLAGEALKQLLLARLNVNKLLGRHEQSSAEGAEKALAALKVAMTAFGAGIANDDVRKIFSDVNANVENMPRPITRRRTTRMRSKLLRTAKCLKMAQAIAADRKQSSSPV